MLPSFNVGVINSNIETFSIVGLEFILAGLPIIVTQCGGPEDYFEEEMGLMVEPNNEAELGKALETLFTQYDNYSLKLLGEKVISKYGEEGMSIKLRHIYSDILKGVTR